jgi:hypothetical protein
MSEENLTTADQPTENKISEVTSITKDTDVQKTPKISVDAISETIDPSILQDKSLDELLEIAKGLLVKTPKMASDQFSLIRKKFYDKYNTEKDQEYDAYKKEDNDADTEFVFSKHHLIDQIRGIEEQIKQALKEEKERIELEKKKNLVLKKKLLIKLEELVSQDETLETINEVKEIQKEWKAIRILPKESVNELWDKYNFLQNKFYDNHSINIELKELDRQKNLAYKIELTKKVEGLMEEKSIKRCFIMLNKYHEEFKNTGPVPRESSEPIWQAFKKASDAVHEVKQKIIEELESNKVENLKKKEILLEKAILINAVQARTPKEWSEKTKQFDDLFTEWKKIGPVPKSNKDAVWINFNGNRNDFFSQKKIFFNELNEQRNENLKAKETLCEQVEALKSSTDWVGTAKKIIQIQADWKKIGPIPEKYNQKIWKKFRAACDFFFDAKNEANAGKREIETENLKKKEELIAQLQELASSEAENKTAFQSLKKINAAWRTIGFIPHKHLNRVNKAYDTASNAVYKKYSQQIEKEKAANLTEHYSEIINSNQGSQALEKEERNIQRKIKNLNEEIASIETNMSFFAASKTADKMLKEFEQKINKTKKHIDRLKKELTTIKHVRRTNAKETQSEES